jgi:hypothetical protein
MVRWEEITWLPPGRKPTQGAKLDFRKQTGFSLFESYWDSISLIYVVNLGVEPITDPKMAVILVSYPE